MAYRIACTEAVPDAIRRIAREQIDKAIDEIDDDALDRHETVHQVRKRCKKLRGLVRLVRPQLGEAYAIENRWYRDSARMLSHVRDAQGIIETFEELIARFDDQIDADAFAALRAQLTARRREVAEDEVGIDERLAAFRARMDEARERVAGWRIAHDGFEALAGGLLKTYRRGRKAMAAALATPSTRNVHEWRKRTKYHWHHVRLLRCAWDEPLGALAGEVHRLSDHLGDDHDLAILRQTLAGSCERTDADTLAALGALIAQRRVESRIAAARLGVRVYAEKPKHLRRRLRAYWAGWRDDFEPAAHRAHEPRA